MDQLINNHGVLCQWYLGPSDVNVASTSKQHVRIGCCMNMGDFFWRGISAYLFLPDKQEKRQDRLQHLRCAAPEQYPLEHGWGMAVSAFAETSGYPEASAAP